MPIKLPNARSATTNLIQKSNKNKILIPSSFVVKQKIFIKVYSNNNRDPKIKKLIKALARSAGLRTQSYVNLKNKKKLLISLISGPHIHKKSRDQYFLQEKIALFTLNLKNESDLKNFFLFKRKLYQLNQGVVFKITYIKKETIDLPTC